LSRQTRAIRKTHNERFEKVRTAIAILATCLLSLSTGCGEASGRSPLQDEVKELRKQKSQLLNQAKLAEDRNTLLEDQIRVLSGLNSDVRLEHLNSLERVKIGRRTNIYDKDKDGKKEKLIVYVEPIDQQGDVVKTVGSVNVQLWDLNKQQNEALVGQWRIEVAELKKLWFATVVTSNYRLLFDISDKIDTIELPLTVKIVFTDYLSGRVFKEERVIKQR